MHQHLAVAEGLQHAAVGQHGPAQAARRLGPEQEVAVAGEHRHRPAARGLGQRLQRLRHRADRVGRGVELLVADPDLEQVAQQHDQVGIAGRQVFGQRVGGGGCLLAKVQVGQQLDAAPVRRGMDLAGGPERAVQQRDHSTITARVMTTSSTGTSSWKPREPVRTFSIWSTIAVPSTTRPKTA